MTYAKQTEVTVEKTRLEIERILTRYGATGFAYAWDGNRAMIAFQMQRRRVQMALMLPEKKEFEYKKINQSNYREKRTKLDQERAWEQACRVKWRAMLLIIKAKLEAVESGITTLEDEFLAHIALPGGTTVGQWMQPQIERAYETGDMPPLLPGS